MQDSLKKFSSFIQPLRNYAARHAGVAAILVLCAVFSAAGLHAQGYGTISGTVTDPTGALVGSATVTALQTLNGVVTTTDTDRDGHYVFPTLLPAPYVISVSAAGFQTYKQAGVVLEANQALTVNITLKVGAQTQTVSVTAATRRLTPPPAPCRRSSTRPACRICP